MWAFRLSAALGLLVIGAATTVATAPAATAAAPIVSSFAPVSGTIGTTVTVSGAGFSRVSEVAFNGAAATFAVKSTTKIIATVPARASTGPIAVTTAGGTGQSASTFTVTPGIALSKTSGPPTTKVGVVGAGFGALEAVDVYFDSALIAVTRTGSTGTFGPGTISVPASAAPGPHFISARGLRSGRRAGKAFTVRTDWPTFGYSDQHTGFNPYENVLNPADAANLEQAWTVPTGALASLVEVNGVVYAGSGDGEVYALSGATGAQLWTFTADGSTTTPAVVNGIVYVGSAGGHVYALNATTGAELWSFSTGGNDVYSPPTVANGVLYVGSGPGVGTLYALDAATGAQLWTFTVGFIIGASPAVANGVVYISADNGLYALNAATGTVLWSFTQGGTADSDPVVDVGVVYVSVEDGHLYALNATTGAVLWSVRAGSAYANIYSDPAVANGVVYVGSTDHDLYALNAATGT